MSTVKLKDGLTWHDGQPITADDFIFTLECNLDTNNGAGFANVAFVNDQPVGYEKIDDLTVKLTLPRLPPPMQRLSTFYTDAKACI